MKSTILACVIAWLIPLSAMADPAAQENAKLLEQVEKLDRRARTIEAAIASIKKEIARQNVQIARLGGKPVNIPATGTANDPASPSATPTTPVTPTDPSTRTPSTPAPPAAPTIPAPPSAAVGGKLPKPMAMFTFDKATVLLENGKQHIRDTSNSKHNGVNEGVELKAGIVGEAGYFAGKGQSLIVATLMDDLTKNVSALTVSCWAKPDQVVDQGYLFCAGWNGGYAVMLGTNKSGWFGGVRSTDERVISGPVPTQTWTHLSLTWDGRNSTLYVDGKSVGQITHPPSTLTRQTLNAPANLLHRNKGENEGWDIPRIGTQAKGRSRNERSFIGHIDEMVIYAATLSPDQIKLLYDSGKAGVGLDKLH